MRNVALLAITAAITLSASLAQGQNRSVGGTIQSGKSSNLFSTSTGSQLSAAGAKSGLPQPGNSSSGSASGVMGMGQGNWYIQRQHGAGSFVGADSGDASTFVGAQQSPEEGLGAAGIGTNANPLGLGLGLRFSTLLNRPMVPRKTTELYYPRVEVGFTPPARDTQAVSATVVRQIMASPGLRLTSPVEVSVEGTTATIRGGVASAQDRILAERMLLFEPGISSVRNLLTLPAPPPPLPLPATQPTAPK